MSQNRGAAEKYGGAASEANQSLGAAENETMDSAESRFFWCDIVSRWDDVDGEKKKGTRENQQMRLLFLSFAQRPNY